jgi:hypothetical protein
MAATAQITDPASASRKAKTNYLQGNQAAGQEENFTKNKEPLH